MSKKIKAMIAIGLVVVVAGTGIFAVVQSKNTDSASKPAVTAKATGALLPTEAIVERTEISSNVYISGTVEANDSRSISFMGGGNVDKVHVKAGDRVEVGQLLAKINSDKLDSELKRLQNELSIANDELKKMKDRGTGSEESNYKTAQLNYENAKKQYESSVSLHGSGAISSDEVSKAKQQMDLSKISLDNAKVALDQAKNQVDANIKVKMMESTKIAIANLQKDIEKTMVKAPIAGTVTTINAKEGEVLPATGILLTIEDLDKKLVKAFVSETEINKIQLGQKVVITGNAIKGKEFGGSVSYIAPGTIRSEGNKNVKVEVKITLDSNVPELRPGFNVNLEVQTASRTGVLAVPFEAINTDEDGKKFVNVITEKEVKKVIITTGVEGDVVVEVISGDLKEGDKLQL